MKGKKEKVRPITGHEGPEVQLYSFFNLGARWGRRDSQGQAAAALPRERDPVPVIQVAAWNPGQSGRVQKILPSTDFDPQTV